MDFIKSNLTVALPISNGMAEIGVDGDIIVPDVCPDILKVIQVDGNAFLTDKEQSGDKIKCGGSLCIKILYIPDSSEEKVKSIVTKLDFSHSLNAGDDTCIHDIWVDVTKIDFQMINSRKLRIRSGIGIYYNYQAVEDIELASDCDEELCMETKKKSLCSMSFAGYKDTQFLIRESLELQAGQEAIAEILKIDTEIIDTEYKVMSGRVVIKGICSACVLYNDSSSRVRYAGFELPFTEIIDLDKADEETICDIDYSICDVLYRVENDNDGDSRVVYLEVIAGARINSYNSRTIDYIEDCYCPGRIMSTEKGSKQLENIVASEKTSVNLREIIPQDKNSPKLIDIYNLVTKTVVEGAKAENGRIHIEGKIICYCLYICEEGEVPIFSTTREIAFSENIEADECKSGYDCKVKAEVTHKNYTVNSAGETEIKLILSISAEAVAKTEIPIYASFELEKPNVDEKKGIVIYFVQGNESLWDVAKRYRVSVVDIAELNSLEAEELTVGTKLLIPSV